MSRDARKRRARARAASLVAGPAGPDPETFRRVAARLRSESKAETWFREPNPHLGGPSPLALYRAGYGETVARFVRDATDTRQPMNSPRACPAREDGAATG